MTQVQEFGPDTLKEVWEEAFIYIQAFPQRYVLGVIVGYIEHAMTEQMWTITIYYNEVA